MEGITLQELHDKLLQGNLDPKEVKNATKYQKDSFPSFKSILSWTDIDVETVSSTQVC